MATDDSEGVSKQYKSVFHRNVKEKFACDQDCHNLDLQKKAFDKNSNREELEMRKLLQKLKADQQSSYTRPLDKGVSLVDNLEGMNIQGIVSSGFIEPYPVTILSRKQRRKTLSGSEGRPDTRQSREGRKKSIEYEDIYFRPSSSGSLPPIKGTRSPSTIFHGVFRTNSLKNLVPIADVDPPWVGDPEAIASVRRARLTVAEQRHRHVAIRGGLESGLQSQYMLLQASVSELPTTPQYRGISRHSSLKESRPSTRNMRSRTSENLDLAASTSMIGGLYRPTSLSDISVTPEDNLLACSNKDALGFPPVKQSAIPFSILQDEKEWKCNLKRRRSSKKNRRKVGVANSVSAEGSELLKPQPGISPTCMSDNLCCDQTQ